MPIAMTQGRRSAPADYSACMSACEACLVACHACTPPGQPGSPGAVAALPDATLCVQACELALHAMGSDALIAPSACRACARCCEALARDYMLLGAPQQRACAQACWRAARECHKVAEACARPVAPRELHALPA